MFSKFEPECRVLYSRLHCRISNLVFSLTVRSIERDLPLSHADLCKKLTASPLGFLVSTYLESLLRFGVLALVGMPVSRESSVALGNLFLSGFFSVKALVVKPEDTVAIVLAAKDVFGIVVRPPIKV